PGIDFLVPADESAGQRFSVTLGRPLSRPPAQSRTVRATGIVRGRVVSTDGQPVPRAQVRLVPQRDLGQWHVVIADENGRFEFLELAAGTVRVVAAKTGYSPLGDPVRLGLPPLTSGRSLDLGEGETREGI